MNSRIAPNLRRLSHQQRRVKRHQLWGWLFISMQIALIAATALSNYILTTK